MEDWLRWLIVGCSVALILTPRVGNAQSPLKGEERAAVVSPDSALIAGRRAWKGRDTARARRYFEKAFAEAPALRSEAGGAAYWLGRVYRAEGKSPRALKTWKQGVEAQRRQGTVGILLANAYLRALTETEVDDQFQSATQAYQAILARAGSGLRVSADSIVRRHVAQLAPILSQDVVRSLIRGTADASVAEWTLMPEAGDRLLRWWRRHDPLPATARNERMVEHLQRVAHAQQQFACDEPECQPAGWDERGAIYVRFGPPARHRSIRYNDADFNLDVFRFGVPVSRHDFPDNELWVYSRIDQSGAYLFVKDDGYYQVSVANDLLPPRMRSGYGGQTDRNLNKAVSALAALRHIYEQLSQYHIRYAQRYAQIANYASWQQEQSDLIDMGVRSSSRTRTVGSGVGQKKRVGPGPPGPDAGYPNEFISDHLHASKTRDQEAARRREKRMPAGYSRVSDDVASLPVAVRTARFLTEAGSTQVRIAWSHPPNALTLSERVLDPLEKAGVTSPEGHLIRLQAVQQDTIFRRRVAVGRQYFVEHKAAGRHASVDVQAVTLKGRTDPFHVWLQWDQRVALSRKGSQVQRGPLAKRAVRKIDSLATLPDEESKLIMSDVMPVRLPKDEPLRKENMTPYPFSSIEISGNMGLYFELYNLELDGEGQSTYTVEYKVEAYEEGGGWKGIFDSKERTQTVMTSTYRGQSRKTEEFIAFNLANWKEVRKGNVAITVQVTDETSGHRAERTISFTIPE